MGYHHLDPYDVDPEPNRSSTRRSIGEYLGLENIGINLYDIAPGEQAPLKYHYHTEQEEVFYVVDGDLHIETEEGEFVVSAGEFFAVEPGSPQRAYNPAEAEETVRTIIVGAPPVEDYAFPDEDEE